MLVAARQAVGFLTRHHPTPFEFLSGLSGACRVVYPTVFLGSKSKGINQLCQRRRALSGCRVHRGGVRRARGVLPSDQTGRSNSDSRKEELPDRRQLVSGYLFSASSSNWSLLRGLGGAFAACTGPIMKVGNLSRVPAARPFNDASATCKPRTSASAANLRRRPAPARARLLPSPRARQRASPRSPALASPGAVVLRRDGGPPYRASVPDGHARGGE
jgi:hypothetical protein